MVAMREFGFIPAAITRQIYFSSNNPCIECEDKALYLNKLHSAVKNHGCSNYKGARIPVPSGLNIKVWGHILRDYDIVNLAEYLEFGFPLGVDYSLFQFKKFDKNHLSAIQKPEGVNKYFKVEVEKQAMLRNHHSKKYIIPH